MTNPETNEVAIAWRLIGMAARIHEHEPPEAIAREAKAAFDDLQNFAGGDPVRRRAADVAERLQAFAHSVAPEARDLAEHALGEAVKQLRAAIADQQNERAAA